MTDLMREIEKKASQLPAEERELLVKRLPATFTEASLTEVRELSIP